MTVTPTYDEWQEAYGCARDALLHPANESLDPLTRAVTEAALGPCPPEPPPRIWRRGVGSIAVESYGLRDRKVWVGFSRKAHETLTPDEADAMAAALVEHARYAREQEAPSLGVSPLRMPVEVCGHLVADEDLEGDTERCQRDVGHDGVCKATSA